MLKSLSVTALDEQPGGALDRRCYQLLAENINDAIFALDEYGCFSYTNQSIERLTAYPVDEVLGRDFTFCAHPDDVPQLINALMHNLRGSLNPFEFRIVTRDGSVRYVSASSRPIFEQDRFIGLAGVLSDITQRKKSEQELSQYREHLEELVASRTQELERINLKLKEKIEEKSDIEVALRRSEKQFRALAENSPDVIARIDRELNVRYVNDQIKQLSRLGALDFIGRNLREIRDLPETVRNHMIEKILEVFATGQPLASQWSFVDEQGQRRHIDWRIQPEIGDDQHCETVISTSRDITALMQAQEQRQLLASVMEGATESVVIFDSQGRIQYANAAYRELSGLTAGDQLADGRIFDSDDELVPLDIETHLSAGQAWTGTFAASTCKGYRIQDMSVTPASTPPGEVQRFIALSRDVTNEVELEKKLVQAQKMEAIGTLAGGIAHDFNNILSAILGYTELAMHDLAEDSRTHQRLREVHKAGLRAGELVKQILTFSREGEHERKPIRLQPVIEEALKLLRGTIPTTIAIEAELDRRCGLVMADPTRIHQVVMNLCTNAYHAMPDGGRLTVTLEELELDAADCQPPTKPGPYVVLSVSDTGTGMSREVMARIFDPYYTTKAPGKGTGLGLSVVHGVVTRSGGHVTVESQPGQGSTFRLYFPRMDAAASPQSPRREAGVPHGSERVLLVDDDPMLLEMMRELLEYLGYRVTALPDGRAALELFRQDTSAFDLVITDQTMPGLTGAELTRELLILRPDLPIILSTGYSCTGQAAEIMSRGCNGFIQKPFNLEALSQKIHEVLARECGSTGLG